MTTNKLQLPEQRHGREMNAESSIKGANAEQAKIYFAEAKQRLLNVNGWQHICGQHCSAFQLTDEGGEPINGEPKPGNYFRIDIPGPGSSAGDGYDWVKVEEVNRSADDKEDVEFVHIKVKPAYNPTTTKTAVAHFLTEDATSNFVLKREKNMVTAAVYGRNEMPNTDTGNTFDKARNALIGSSAVAGFAYPQWKQLVDAILQKKSMQVSFTLLFACSLMVGIFITLFLKRNK